MIVFAVVLGLVGAVALGLAVEGLWTSRPYIPGKCAMPSPDDEPCSGTLAHIGWHHRAGLQWYGDGWQLPTETVRAVALKPARTVAPRRRTGTPSAWWVMPWVGMVGAAAVIAGVAVAIQPDPPPKPRDCAMKWQDAYPLHPVCPDSPDLPGYARPPSAP